MSNFSNKEKINLRARTLALTFALTTCIIFYCLMQWVITGNINLISLVMSGLIQILTHFAYYDDGKINGEKDSGLKANKDAYNDKANKVNDENKFSELKKYCQKDFDERKKRYLSAKFSYIGISEIEFEILKQKSECEIKKLKKFEKDGKVIYFTEKKRKALFNLIFKPLPIEPNEPEFIMSAVSFDKSKGIKDKSVLFEKVTHLKVILKATILALFIAYIGISLQDNFSWESVIEMIYLIVVMIYTAIFSFSSGEKYNKVYKSNFYNELTMFLDGFFEYINKSNLL